MSGEVLPALLRGLHVGATLSLLGVLVYRQCILPAAPAGPDAADQSVRWQLARLASVSAGAALLFGAAWFVAVTADIAGVSQPGAVAGFVPVVALHTQFGTWLALRLVLLLLVLLLPAGPALRWIALLLAAAAVAEQPMLAHAGAEPGPRGGLLIAGEAVHVLAAGAWFGGLLPLWLSVRRLPAASGWHACRRFSRLGMAAVASIVAGGVVLGALLAGGVAGLLHSTYGNLLLLKTGLFLAALGLAGLNRYRLTPAVQHGERRGLLSSVAAEAAIGIAIVLVAAFLASSMPGADMQHRAHPGMSHGAQGGMQ